MRIRAAATLVALLVAACGAEADDRSADTPTTTSTSTTTTAAPTATPSSSANGVGALDLCAGAVHEVGATIVDDRLIEISGIAFSRLNPDRLYAHNDSGDSARLFSIGADGKTTNVITVDTVALDWEDMAAADGALFVADIGDNLGIRPTVRIVAIDELTTVPVSYTISYPSGRPDAEAVIIDPSGSLATIITKDLTGQRSRIYEAQKRATEAERCAAV